jgi:GWxTD domain-containing protein
MEGLSFISFLTFTILFSSPLYGESSEIKHFYFYNLQKQRFDFSAYLSLEESKITKNEKNEYILKIVANNEEKVLFERYDTVYVDPRLNSPKSIIKSNFSTHQTGALHLHYEDVLGGKVIKNYHFEIKGLQRKTLSVSKPILAFNINQLDTNGFDVIVDPSYRFKGNFYFISHINALDTPTSLSLYIHNKESAKTQKIHSKRLNPTGENGYYYAVRLKNNQFMSGKYSAIFRVESEKDSIVHEIDFTIPDRELKPEIAADQEYYNNAFLSFLKADDQAFFAALSNNKKIEFIDKYLPKIIYIPSDNNEAIIKIFARRVELSKKYNTIVNIGYMTDRGRVLIKYGQPNEIATEHLRNSGESYEIWMYEFIRNEGNVLFLFLKRNNNYFLRHSTLSGEIKMQNWETVKKQFKKIDLF